MSGPVFMLRTLGSFELVDRSGTPVTSLMCRPRRMALLIYLTASEPEFHSRASVGRMFWPNASAYHARAALKQAAHSIRKVLGQEVFRSRVPFEIGVDRSIIACDVAELRSAVRGRRYRQEANLYRGQFLEGFDPDVGDLFQCWVEDQRAMIEALRSSLMSSMGNRPVTDA
jgi:DNA-binding SARP family transcriptional activator